MKKILTVLAYVLLLPFVISIPGLILSLFGLFDVEIVLVPLLAVLFYFLKRKKYDMRFAALVNGMAFGILLFIFTVMMIITSGNLEGRVMSYFTGCVLPFLPIILIDLLTGQILQLYVTVFLTYGAACLVCALFARVRIRRIRILIPAAASLICIAVCIVLGINRPAVRYAGHGFQYMNGYSSTDFRDYMVYSNPSKLVTVSGLPDSFIIENENDMPRLDGAEACYPLYAAFAKASYKDIDRIELNDQGKHRADNGKIVTFTNSLVGFERLIFGAPGSDRAEEGIDMFFGARPSKSQLWFAEEMKVDLEITPIAREGFIFFVEADNPVTDLTSDQLKAIYHGDITNWKELGGKDQPIRAFQRPEGSGSQTMMQYFMGDLSLKKPESYEVVGAMEGVVTKVAEYHNEAGALGYSFRYFLEGLMQEKGVRMLSIDGVYPSIENIENGTYPLITNVVVITRKNEDHPGIAKMLNLILSDYGQDIIRRTGYAPLPRE